MNSNQMGNPTTDGCVGTFVGGVLGLMFFFTLIVLILGWIFT